MKKAVILISGGLDSATTCAIAKDQNYELFGLSFFYGQRHNVELESAKKIANFFQLKEHKIANIDLRIFGGSALTSDIEVPKNNINFFDKNIPLTYVPARNTIFLSYALAFAEVINCYDIFIGVNAVDYSGYPDCRPKYIESYQEMANLACASSIQGKNKIIIHTPLINLKKTEIIKFGIDLGVDYSMTHSCYDPILKNQKYYACGQCDSCQIRLKGFAELKIKDPISYIASNI